MANKFLINSLSSKALPLDGNDYTIIENNSCTYHVDMQSIYKDILSNRLSVSVGRTDPKGPNKLSVWFKENNDTFDCLNSIDLQDGMLSTVEFNSTNNVLSLVFNTTKPSNNTISVNLNSLKDIYHNGYGLGLSNVNGEQQFYIEPSAITELTTLSNNVSSISDDISIINDNMHELSNQISSNTMHFGDTSLSNYDNATAILQLSIENQTITYIPDFLGVIGKAYNTLSIQFPPKNNNICRHFILNVDIKTLYQDIPICCYNDISIIKCDPQSPLSIELAGFYQFEFNEYALCCFTVKRNKFN